MSQVVRKGNPRVLQCNIAWAVGFHGTRARPATSAERPRGPAACRAGRAAKCQGLLRPDFVLTCPSSPPSNRPLYQLGLLCLILHACSEALGTARNIPKCAVMYTGQAAILLGTQLGTGGDMGVRDRPGAAGMYRILVESAPRDILRASCRYCFTQWLPVGQPGGRRQRPERPGAPRTLSHGKLRPKHPYNTNPASGLRREKKQDQILRLALL